MANEQGMPDLNTILENPELMAKIRSLAKGLAAADGQGINTETTDDAEKPETALPASSVPGISPAFSGIGKQDIALLKAISPYLSHDKQEKLNQVLKFLNMAQLAQGMKDIL